MAEAKKRGRGATRPLNVRLNERVETERQRVEFHEKHLKEAKAQLRAAEAQLNEHESEEKKTAHAKIAEYEAELSRLKSLV